MKYDQLLLLLLASIPQLTNTAPVILVTPSFETITSSVTPTARISATFPQLSLSLVLDKIIPTSSVKPLLYQTSTQVSKQSTNTSHITPSLTVSCTANCSVVEVNGTSNGTNDKGSIFKRSTHHNYFLYATGSLSVFALILNFVLMTKICSCNGVNVLVLFGICLMLFNIILACYGIAIAGYLYKGPINWTQKFCQGFTSVKLFSLGSAVWTLIMLTFHNSITESSEELRDAVFKGIVYILEGVMLSGVMAVMAWIKLDSWDYLCSITNPVTTVEWLLTGIELWYYLIALLLLVRYPIYLYRRYKRRLENDKLTKRTQEHFIFILIIISLAIWAASFTITYLGYFDLHMSAVIRVCSLMSVAIIQPFIYSTGTSCFPCKNSPCSTNKKNNPVEDVLLVCECTGSETCPACDSEYDPLARYGDTVFTESPSKMMTSSDDKLDKEINGKVKESKKKKVKQTEDIIRKNKKRKKKSKVSSPPPVCRSPEIRATLESVSSQLADKYYDNEKESTPLLEVNPEKKESMQKIEVKKSKQKGIECIPLLDDTDGSKSPPKALPEESPLKSSNQENCAVSSPPRKNHTEFPSFISLNDAVNVDELPKEAPKVLRLSDKEFGLTTKSPEERVSRGPTFYAIEGDKTQVISQSTKIQSPVKDSVKPEIKIATPTPNNEKEKVSGKKKKRKNSEKDENSKSAKKDKSKKKLKEKNKSSKTEPKSKHSTESLVWDHSYSCSDSGESAHHIEDSTIHQESETNCFDKPHKNSTMEWDPSDLTNKDSIDEDTIANQSPAPDWEPYITEEGRSSSTVNTMSKQAAHLSTDVSFDNTSGEIANEQNPINLNGFQSNNEQTKEHSKFNENESDTAKNVSVSKKKLKEKEKTEKKKHKQENGKIKKLKKKNTTKPEEVVM